MDGFEVYKKPKTLSEVCPKVALLLLLLHTPLSNTSYGLCLIAVFIQTLDLNKMKLQCTERPFGGHCTSSRIVLAVVCPTQLTNSLEMMPYKGH